MNKLQFTEYLTSRYRAKPVEEARCRPFLPSESEFVLGFHFPDAEANFALLSDFDLKAFPPDEEARIRANRRSPFSDILLIAYHCDDELSWKLINGMGSKLFPLIEDVSL